MARTFFFFYRFITMYIAFSTRADRTEASVNYYCIIYCNKAAYFTELKLIIVVFIMN